MKRPPADEPIHLLIDSTGLREDTMTNLGMPDRVRVR